MSKFVVLVVAVCLAALVWFFLGDDGGGTDSLVPAGPSASESLGARDSNLGSVREPESAPAVELEPAVDLRAEVEPAPEPSVALEFAEWPASGRELELVVAATGEPAAGAVVRQLDGSTIPEHHTVALVAVAPELDFGSVGPVTLLRADEAGRVRVADLEGGSFVVVELGELRGYLGLGSRYGGSSRIELRKPFGLEVRVENESGEPLPDFPISFEPVLDDWLLQWAHTDAEGRYRVYNVNTVLEPVLRTRGVWPAMPVEVRTDSWGQVVGRAIDLEVPPEAPLVLVVPSGGTVEVRVAAYVGQQLPNVVLAVGLELELGGTNVRREGRFSPERPAVFRGVPAGARVTASLDPRRTAGRWESPAGIVPEPGAAALELEVVLDRGAGRTVTGRLVDTAGAPIAGMSVRSSVSQRIGGSNTSNASWCRTEKDGRFYLGLGGFPLRFDASEAETSFEFKLEREGEELLMGKVAPMLGVLGLPIDVGDVVMRPPPLLVAGRVVDGSGAPVEGARVEAQKVPAGVALDELSGLPVFTISLAGMEAVETDAQGAFELRGETEQRPLFVRAEADGYMLSPLLAITPGREGVELVVQRSGSVVGSLRLPKGAGALEWYVGIKPMDPALLAGFEPVSLSGGYRTSSKWYDERVQGSGEFVWSGLAPGLYSMRVMLGGMGEPTRSFEDVRIVGGEVTRDPRLQEIDLLDDIAQLELSVVDEAGEPIDPAFCLLQAGEASGVLRVALHDGLGTLFYPSGPARLLVGAPGYWAKQLVLEGAAVQVTLERSFDVFLTLPEGIVLPEGVELSAGLQPKGEGDGMWGQVSPGQDYEWTAFKDGEARLAPMALGPNRLGLRLSRTFMGVRQSSWVRLPRKLRWVEIGVDSEGERFEIPVDRAAIDKELGL